MDEEILEIFNPETNTTYQVKVGTHDYNRALNDVQFAQSLLFHAETNTNKNNLSDKAAQEQTTNNASSELESQGSDPWSHEETLLLINLYGEHKEDFLKAKRRRTVWTTIAERMSSHGYNRSPEKTERKWLNLMLVYRKIKDNQSPRKTGKGALLYKYFEKMDEIIGDKPSNKSESSAVLSVGASGLPESPVTDSIETETETPDNDKVSTCSEASSIEPQATTSKKRKQNLSSLSKEYIDVKRHKETAKQQRHEEIMKLEEKKFLLEERKVDILERLLDHFNN